jgi:hypothetical protein
MRWCRARFGREKVARSEGEGRLKALGWIKKQTVSKAKACHQNLRMLNQVNW